MELGLQGKTALITGASKGLGFAIADELAKEGANVSICARGSKDLDAAANVLRERGVSVVSICADVALDESPRVHRRPFRLSQAAMTDPVCWR